MDLKNKYIPSQITIHPSVIQVITRPVDIAISHDKRYPMRRCDGVAKAQCINK